MSLLGREVLGYLMATAAWMVAVAAITVVVAVPVSSRTRLRRQSALAAGAAGAVVAASLAVRFSAPTAWLPSIGGRVLPVGWSLAGAGCGVVVALWRARSGQDEREPGRMSG